MKCPGCKWDYPDEAYLSEVMINGKYTAPICGICALQVTNEGLGIKRTSFHGEMAEEMRQDALRFRKQNPEKAPR